MKRNKQKRKKYAIKKWRKALKELERKGLISKASNKEKPQQSKNPSKKK